MKKFYLLGQSLCLVFLSFSQNNIINYKALVKDNFGNPLISQNIDVRFTIFSGSSQVYQETHSTTTDSNGIAIVDIGAGSTSDDFTAINWSEGTNSLRTEIDSGSGFVDIGTTNFKSVPYALNAGDKVLTEVIENNNTGWRLFSEFVPDGTARASIGVGALDLSKPGDPGWDFVGASGAYALSANNENYAGGDYSVAFGNANQSTGTASAAFGDFNWVAGNNSFVSGSNNEISGNNSAGFGSGLFTNTNNSLVIGEANTNEANALFIVGNGSSEGGGDSNALTVFRDGSITAPSLTPSLIGSSGSKVLVTKEYINGLNLDGSVLTVVTENGNTGWQLFTEFEADGSGRAPIGSGALDLTFPNDNTWGLMGASGAYSFVANYDNWASGFASVAFGDDNQASGSSSAAFGVGNWVAGNASWIGGALNESTGNYSITSGESNFSTGNASLTIGQSNNSTGHNSLTSGQSLIVSSNNAMAIGTYNIDDPNALFMIGNGTFSNRANALIVLNDGKTTVEHSTSIDNNDHALNGIKTFVGSTDAAGVYGENIAQPGWGTGVKGRGDWKGVEGIGGFYGVYGEGTSHAVYANGNLSYTGTLNNASDRKLKTNIKPINNALEEISQLNPATYDIKQEYVQKMNMSSKPQIGFIAQELQQVFPNLVSKNIQSGRSKKNKEEEYLSVNYIGLIPVLTAGIKEQQNIIEQQQQTIEAQQALLQDLLRRVELLENRD